MSKADLIIARAEELRPRTGRRLAVLVPCFNEEVAIAKVVADFRAALPDAAIYVYDNNSTDRTAEFARTAGALVRREMHRGKGNVVRRMFSDVDSDIYVLVDGDATYEASSARIMVARLHEAKVLIHPDKTHDWLNARLGLDQYPIVKRCDINPGCLYHALSRLTGLIPVDADRRTSARGEGKDCLPAHAPPVVPGAPEGVIAR